MLYIIEKQYEGLLNNVYYETKEKAIEYLIKFEKEENNYDLKIIDKNNLIGKNNKYFITTLIRYI